MTKSHPKDRSMRSVGAVVSANGLFDHTAYWLHLLSTSVLSRFESRLVDAGVTVAQWKVMLVLERSPGSTTFAVADRVKVDAGSVSRVVDRLSGKGLVERTASTDDRRAVALSLTAKGRRLMENHLLPIADAQDDLWLQSLSRAELLVFKGLLAKLLTAQGIETPESWSRSGLCTDPR